MSVVSWLFRHFPETLIVLFIGGLVGTVADYAYEWFFEDDSWTTNMIVVGGITLSIILPLIGHLVRRTELDDAETNQ
jgi:hypothetical protein